MLWGSKCSTSQNGLRKAITRECNLSPCRELAEDLTKIAIWNFMLFKSVAVDRGEWVTLISLNDSGHVAALRDP